MRKVLILKRFKSARGREKGRKRKQAKERSKYAIFIMKKKKVSAICKRGNSHSTAEGEEKK